MSISSWNITIWHHFDIFEFRYLSYWHQYVTNFEFFLDPPQVEPLRFVPKETNIHWWYLTLKTAAWPAIENAVETREVSTMIIRCFLLINGATNQPLVLPTARGVVPFRDNPSSYKGEALRAIPESGVRLTHWFHHPSARGFPCHNNSDVLRILLLGVSFRVYISYKIRTRQKSEKDWTSGNGRNASSPQRFHFSAYYFFQKIVLDHANPQMYQSHKTLRLRREMTLPLTFIPPFRDNPQSCP